MTDAYGYTQWAEAMGCAMAAERDKQTPTWEPCPDCGAPMVDDDGNSWPYCPIDHNDEEYPW